MKIKKAFGLALISFALGDAATAQDGTWTNETDSAWSISTNWLNGIVAGGGGNTATFSNELFSAVTVSLDSARTIGNLLFVQGAYTITNDGLDTVNILTLDGPAKPVINIPAGMTPTIRRTVWAGTNGFVLDGGGQLNLFKENTASNNTLTGSVVLSNGTIQVQGINVGNDNFANTLALNSVSSFTFINGTVNLQPAVNTSPEYGNVNGNLHVPAGGVGTIVLPVRFAGASGDNAAAIGSGLGGNLTGSGTFNVRSRYVRGNVVGEWSAFAGLLDIGPSSANADNSFRFGNPSGFPNAVVNFSGTTPLSVFYYRALTTNTTIPMGVLSGENPQTFLNGSATAAFTLIYDVGALHANATDSATFAGTIGNAAGPAGLIKRGAGTLILTGNNNYTGPTTISNGVVQIGDGFSDSGAIGTGPITNHGALIFAHGAGPLIVTAPISGAGAITNIGAGGTLSLLGTNTYTAPTVSTAGKLIIGTASRSTGAYLLRGAAEGFGVKMTRPGATLTISNLSYSATGTFDIDVGTFGNPAAAIVTNTGNITLNGDVTVNITGTGLSIGTITLLQYESRSGTGNFVLGALPSNVTGFTFNDDMVNKRVTLTITVTFDNTLQWIGNAAGIWDVDNSANPVWRIVQSGQLTNYYDGAKVRFDDSATGTTTIDVSTSVSPTSVIVSNSTLAYRFAGIGAISGTTGLTKQGTNKLTFANANSYSGPTIIEAGLAEVGDGATDGAPGTGAITNSGTLLLNLALGPLTLANAIHGTGNVVQAGVGQVNLSGANTYSGGLTVKPGTTLGNNSGNAAGVGGGLRIESATVVLGADIANSVGGVSIITNATFRNTGANRVIDTQIRGTNVTLSFDKTPNIITVNRDMSDISGVITNTGTGLLRFNSGGNNNAMGSANALWVLETVGGFLQPRNTSVNLLGAVTGVGTLSAQQTAGGANLTTWVVGDLNTSTLFEGVISDGASFGQLPRYTAITKVGTGTWTLNNVTMSYRSSTVVSNGTLALTGSSLPDVTTNIVVAAPGVLDVAGRTDGTLTLGAGTTNQTLRGDGMITGNLVLGALGRLEPGFSAGTLTVSGSATLGGTNVMELTTTGGAASDRLVAANINYSNGTLILTNLGNITGSNVFQLFSGGISGSFANIITQSLGGVTWDLSQLNVNGSVRLIGPNVNIAPSNITASVTGNQLDLQWPSDHIGWELQTNAVSVAEPNSWFVYPPSLATNRVILTVDPARTNVYYRLHYQFAP